MTIRAIRSIGRFLWYWPLTFYPMSLHGQNVKTKTIFEWAVIKKHYDTILRAFQKRRWIYWSLILVIKYPWNDQALFVSSCAPAKPNVLWTYKSLVETWSKTVNFHPVFSRRCWTKVMRLTWRLENRTTSLLSLLQGVTKAKRRHPGDTVCCHHGVGCRAAVTVQCCWVFDGPPSSEGIWVLPFYQLARRNRANKSDGITSTNFCSHICWQFGFKLALILD